MAGKIKNIALIQVTRMGVSRPDIGLGAGYLKSYLEHECPGRFNVEIFNSQDYVRNYLHKNEFDFVGLSTVSHLYDVAIDIAKQVKEVSGGQAVTAVGGAHITALPESLDEAFDWGMVGEGEITFVELIRALDEGVGEDEIAGIHGLIRLVNGELQTAPARALIRDLNTLPFPARDIFQKYHSIPSIISARGCPFQCDFCTNNIMWQRLVRRPEPHRVTDEIQHLVDHVDDVKVLVFRDDILFMNKKYLEAVLDDVKRRAPHLLEIPKVGYSHVHVVDKEFVHMLKELGVKRILCGFESGSERILNILKAGKVTTEQNQRAIDTCHKYGLDIGGNLIVGTPDEEPEDLIATYEFVKRNLESGKVGAFSTSILTPFPGSRYWDIFTKDGFDPKTFDWERLDELGYSTFWEDTNGKGSLEDWWKLRKAKKKAYIGRLPEDEFVSIVGKYEPWILKTQAEFLKKDRKY